MRWDERSDQIRSDQIRADQRLGRIRYAAEGVRLITNLTFPVSLRVRSEDLSTRLCSCRFSEFLRFQLLLHLMEMHLVESGPCLNKRKFWYRRLV